MARLAHQLQVVGGDNEVATRDTKRGYVDDVIDLVVLPGAAGVP
nr:hypothetical protein [Mycolicibacterium fortuitum]